MVQNSTSIGSQSTDATPEKRSSINMTGRLVLIQNSVGIYYGKLERFDTRDGTALLSDGYMISPEKYMTYVQWARLNDGSRPRLGDANRYYPHSFESVHAMATQNTITDYATEGIAPYYIVSDIEVVNDDATKFFADNRSVSLISLTGVSVIVPIDENAAINEVSGDSHLGIMVVDTFNNSIFEPDASGEQNSIASYFGTIGVSNVIVLREEK